MLRGSRFLKLQREVEDRVSLPRRFGMCVDHECSVGLSPDRGKAGKVTAGGKIGKRIDQHMDAHHQSRYIKYAFLQGKLHMIVDFVFVKEKLQRATTIFLRLEIKKRMPFLGQIGQHYLHEGNKHSYETVDHEKENLDFRKGESKITLTREEMSKITFEEITRKMQEVAEDMAGQMERGAFQDINEAMEKHNRNIPGNPPFSFDAFLQGLEIMDIDFDDDSREKPQLPSLVMHPDLAAKAKEQEASMTAEEKQKFFEKQNEILDRKYKEYMEREARRKIID